MKSISVLLQALDDARDYVTKANETLNLAINKTLPYNISKYVSKKHTHTIISSSE
jgi:hypothetical protein